MVGAATADAIQDGKVQLTVEDADKARKRARTQQSSEASHIKPSYPPKTINCSDGGSIFLHLSRMQELHEDVELL